MNDIGIKGKQSGNRLIFFVGKNVDKLWTSMLKTRRNLLMNWG